MNSLPEPQPRFQPGDEPAEFAHLETAASQPAVSYPAVPSVPYTDQRAPGPLRSESSILLQTMQAQRLVRGRDPAEGVTRIVGLSGFGSKLRAMWIAARADDPWADWYLVRVHEALESANTEILALHKHVELLLSRIPGVQVTAMHSSEPMRVPLAFINPYGYRAAYLLARYDSLIVAVLTAVHVALLGREPARRLMHDAGRQVRHAFLSAEGYAPRGVTREDVRQGTAKALDAVQRMGDLPPEILEGQLRAMFSPAPAFSPSRRVPVERDGEDARALETARNTPMVFRTPEHAPDAPSS